MLIQFNLLPWREAQKAKNLKITQGILIGGAVLGFIAGIGMYSMKSIILSDHKKALSIITAKNSKLKPLLQQKAETEAEIKKINTQIGVIERLQANRVSVTHMIEELSIANTQSLFLTSFSLDDGNVSISGIAENDIQIAEFMTSLRKSLWYQEPTLISIVTEPNLGEEVKKFNITSQLLLPGSNK